LVEHVKTELILANGTHKAEYEANAARYLDQIRAFVETIQPVKEQLAGKEVVLLNFAFTDLAKDYGLHVSDILDLDDENQASAGEVAGLIASIKEKNISLVLADDLNGKGIGDTIEKETDAKVLYLNLLTSGGQNPDEWLNGMNHNLDLLRGSYE
jgi:zinc transport system substrate-binding protein